MDLVAGATGLVGQQIALGLRRQGRAVLQLLREDFVEIPNRVFDTFRRA